MLYLNQLDYRHIHYEHNVSNGGVPQERRNIATSGCGICCACMMVEHLTTPQLSIEECVRINYAAGANLQIGTRMGSLGPALADKFNLKFEATKDVDAMLRCLQTGGRVIILVDGDREGYTGLYSHGGHFILAISYDGENLCILDPSYKDGKYQEEGRVGKVQVNYPFTYCKPEYIVEDSLNREAPFFLFWRK